MIDVDIKYLKVVHSLVQYQSVTKTAAVLNISPATVSYAINKIRSITGTHLFVRTREGMIPDAVARDLSSRYQQMTDEHFNAESDNAEKERLTVRTNSLIELLFSRFMNSAENVSNLKTLFLPPEKNDKERIYSLKSFATDLDIGTPLAEDADITKVKLFSSGVSILASENNEFHKEQFTIEDWNNARHVKISMGMDYFCNDVISSRELKKYIDNRDVSLVSPHVLNMISFCASSECLMLIPDIFIPLLEKEFPIKTYPLPNGFTLGYDCYLHYNNKSSETLDFENVISKVFG